MRTDASWIASAVVVRRFLPTVFMGSGLGALRRPGMTEK